MHQQFLGQRLDYGGFGLDRLLGESRGAVVVYASQEDEDPLEENLQGKIDYLSTEEALQSYPKEHNCINLWINTTTQGDSCYFRGH